MDPAVKNLFENVINELKSVTGLKGSLIIDNQGKVLCHSISQGLDVSLFGPMTKVITSSSKKLLNVSNEGEIRSVLVESKNGKILFLHPENFYLVVLMETTANLGLAMFSSKKAVKRITKDQNFAKLENYEIKSVNIQPDDDQSADAGIDRIEIGKADVNRSEIIHETTPGKDKSQSVKEGLTAKIKKVKEKDKPTVGEQVRGVNVAEEHVTDESLLHKNSEVKEAGTLTTEKTNEKTVLPLIKPPISFPKLPKNVEIPEDSEKRSDLILEIYRSLFLAMSIGASKIMGVTPARGLTRKFLPLKQCHRLLDGVDVKSNSTIDFDRIKDNAKKIPVNEREKIFIEDFTKIITIITENYGKVMGYNAFKGMVRSEFRIINESYGVAMEELGIKRNMHPELINLLE
jgi:predicted regulator of Ras-like GTPase activity (Roadblock/LC7/MglB family)